MREPVDIPIPDLFTRYPKKWRLVDTETRQVWEWRGNHWKLAGTLRLELAEVIEVPQ